MEVLEHGVEREARALRRARRAGVPGDHPGQPRPLVRPERRPLLSVLAALLLLGSAAGPAAAQQQPLPAPATGTTLLLTGGPLLVLSPDDGTATPSAEPRLRQLATLGAVPMRGGALVLRIAPPPYESSGANGRVLAADASGATSTVGFGSELLAAEDGGALVLRRSGGERTMQRLTPDGVLTGPVVSLPEGTRAVADSPAGTLLGPAWRRERGDVSLRTPGGEVRRLAAGAYVLGASRAGVLWSTCERDVPHVGACEPRVSRPSGEQRRVSVPEGFVPAQQWELLPDGTAAVAASGVGGRSVLLLARPSGRTEVVSLVPGTVVQRVRAVTADAAGNTWVLPEDGRLQVALPGELATRTTGVRAAAPPSAALAALPRG